MNSPKKPPSFTELYAPKHEGIERWNLLKDEDRAKGFSAFLNATLKKPEEIVKPESLLDLYAAGNFNLLHQDMLARDDHYTDRQKEIIEALVLGKKLDRPITKAEKNELLLQWVRPTDIANRSKKLMQRVTAKRHDEEVILEDGRPFDERAEATFEKQDFGDKIIV